jgi:polar amino acid transport system substrate-binding protein
MYKSLIFISVLIISFNSSSKEVLNFRADEWCPYNCSEKSKKLGYMVDVLNKTFSSKNYEVKYETMNWSRAILDGRSGTIDGIIGAYKSDAEDYIYPTISQGTAQEVFIVKRNNSWKYTGIRSLDDVTLGVIRDYSYGENLDAYIAKNKTNFNRIQIVSGDSPLERNIRKLLNNRVSAVIENENVINWFLKKNPAFRDKVKIAGKRFTKTDVYIAFSPKNKKKSQKLARILSDSFEEMKRNGELETILENYGLSLDSIK